MQNKNNISPETPRPESLRERLHGWRLGFSIDSESLIKALVLALLLILFSLLQTTLFTRFRPFGAVPDLILPLVVAVSMSFREKWGSVFGVIAAFVIESLGGSTFTILPILYMLTGYIIGLCAVYYFRDSFAVRALYTVVTSAFRAVFTLITLVSTVGNLDLITCMTMVILPEFCANVIFAALPHIIARLALKPFTHERKDV